MLKERHILRNLVSDENPDTGAAEAVEQPEINAEELDIEMDSSDVDPEVLKELLGEDQPETESLNHDKSLLGADKDTVDKLEDLLKDNAEPGETKDGESEDLVEVEVNGEMVKVPSAVKNAIMMQSDYTKKTQELAEQRNSVESFQKQLNSERETFQNEMVEFRKANEDSISHYESLQHSFSVIAQQNPDLFEEFEAAVKEAEMHYSNPVVDRLTKQVNELKANITHKEDFSKMGEFFTEWGQAQAQIVPMLKELGIDAKQDEVQNMWGKGLNVKQAINALYGDDIAKMRESKARVAAAKQAATTRKKPSLGGASRAPGSGPKKFNGTGYGEITRHFLGTN